MYQVPGCLLCQISGWGAWQLTGGWPVARRACGRAAMLSSCADSVGEVDCQAGIGVADAFAYRRKTGTGMRTVKQSKAVQLTGQQIRLGNFDIVWAKIELLLDEGFDTIEIRGVRFADDEPEPYLSPLEAEARAAETWYVAHIRVAVPKDK